MADAPWTIGRLLTWTTDYLKQQGAASPRLDAEVLLAFARDCERIDLYTAFGDVADEALRARFRELVQARAKGTPVAYLVGRKEFYSRPFHVSPAVLIPRPETEFVVLRALEVARSFHTDTLHIADMGTGSGVLAVTLALELPTARVVAVDRSPAALEVAQRNAQQHGVAERIEFVHSDWFASLPPDAPFDLIVSNPPYISRREFEQLAPDVREHEPSEALLGGPEGLEPSRTLIRDAADFLKPGGWLVLETSPTIAEQLAREWNDAPAFGQVHTTCDLAQLARVVSAQKTPLAPTETTMIRQPGRSSNRPPPE